VPPQRSSSSPPESGTRPASIVGSPGGQETAGLTSRSSPPKISATWLSQCPGVLGWLEEHCGRNPYGRTALRDWWQNWSNATEPPVPPALLLAGRGAERHELLAGLAGAASSLLIAAGTEEEAIAFLAAALLVPRPLQPTADGQEPTAEEVLAHDTEEASWREAVLERTIVVQDTSTWRALAAHHEPLILVPTATCEPTIDAAVTSGHHVVLPQIARPGDRSLPRLNRTEAREAWEQAGVSWNESDELARAARRSLTSLRRRRGRAGHLRRPDWSSGTSSRLLAPLLLAASWDSTFAGDQRIVLELADRQSLRSLDGDLAVIASEPDAPVRQRQGGWQFVDTVDAWDQLGPIVSQHDLDLFRKRAIEVLTYRNPALDLPTAERLTADLRGELPPPECSQTLREGFAETIAILGAIREDTPLPGGGTGGSLAARIVREVLHGVPAFRWRSVVDLLPELAEATPSAFLNAVEESLRQLDPPILTLFDERPDDLGLSYHSAHTHLLWALEHLAFSPAHLSRVVVVLGQLTEHDPGGKLQNRPANSLCAILHLVRPQSAVDASSRPAAIDALRNVAPQASWRVLLGLLRGLDRGMILNRGPKHRDWPRAKPPTHRDVFEAVTEIGNRIIDDIGHGAERWVEAMRLVTKLPASVRTRMLTEAGAVWEQLPEDTQRAVLAQLQDQVSRHTKYRDSTWALHEEGLAELAEFVQAHATEADEPGAHELFSFWPDIDGIEPDTPEGQAALRARREYAVRAALPDGIPALAAASAVPGQVGAAVAAVTADLDDEILGWLASDEPHLRAVGQGLACARQQQNSDWLWRTIESHAGLEVELLLTGDLNNALIAYLDTMSDDHQAAFWSKVHPWGVPDNIRLTVAQHLAERDRPFSAMNLLFRDDTDTFPVNLGLEVMAKPLTGSGESLEVLHSPQYVLRGMLDRLAAAGAPTEQLAILEWWYNPALRHERTPAAFNSILARDPVLFARLVALTTLSDEDLAEVNEDSDCGEEVRLEGEDDEDDDDGENDSGGGGGDARGVGGYGDSSWRFPDTPESRQNAFEILREWRVPVPGSEGEDPPETAALQDWVDRVRAKLAVLKRTRAGAHEIGHALSGPAYDPDGTWPCRAVRDVLEHENDSEVETGLWSGRMNDRGVTSRGPYSGGEQERDLAAKYKGWADQVRGTWPRAGALLDSIADSYEAQARYEDGSAEELGDR
jgi:hypothetical protein